MRLGDAQALTAGGQAMMLARDMVNFERIVAARQQLTGQVRLTPMLLAQPLRQSLLESSQVFLKLECLQITGSFKARGALSSLARVSPSQLRRGVVTASGGNHGLGVAYAGWRAGIQTTVFLPSSTPAAKAEKLLAWGAEVIRAGHVWDDANEAALRFASLHGAHYVHPFADPEVVVGQGTLGLEILEQQPDIDVLVVAIGGGGLISGVSVAARALRPGIRIIGVEPVGAPTLHDSLRAGRIIELAQIETAAGTLAPRRTAQLNLDLVRAHVEQVVLVSDDQMRLAAQYLWRELGVAAELSGAAAVAALLSGLVPAQPHERVCAIVCGAGTDGIP